MKIVGNLLLLAGMFGAVSHAQVIQQADGTYLSPYCAVGDGELSAMPGASSYANDRKGYALRKTDGGLQSVAAERGIGSEVSLRKAGNKVVARVVARRVSFAPLVMDKDKILLEEPKSQVEYWEKEVDLTTVDRVEFSQTEVPLNMKLAVGVLRTTP